jgi:RasGEF N-terminal motif
MIDMSYSEVFLATYRYFIPPQKLLNCLIGWYNCEADDESIPGSEQFLKRSKKSIQARSVRVLVAWVRNHWIDFHENPKLLSDLSVFADYVSKISFGTYQKVIQAMREQRLSWYTHQYVPIFLAPKASSPDQTKAWVHEWDPSDFAHNLIEVDHIFFRQLTPDCYFKLIQKSGNVEAGGSNLPLKVLLDICTWFRVVATYTTVAISREDSIKKKTGAIKRFIKIARVHLIKQRYARTWETIMGWLQFCTALRRLQF